MKTIWRQMAAVGCFGLVSTAAGAQSLSDAPQPAEYPPSSYTAAQYVDSKGCAFVRAGVAGVVNWIPRVSRSRDLLCGFQPSLPAAAPELTPTPTPAPVPQTQPQTRAAQASQPPAPVRVARAPIAAASVLPVAPRVVEPPKPQTMTRAEACAGRTGVQPHLISRATGKPLDCGDAVVERVAATVQPSTVNTGSSVNASACLTAIASGAFGRSGNGARAVRCGPQTEPITPVVSGRSAVAAPARVAAPVRVTTPPAAGIAPVPAMPRATAPAVRPSALRASSCLQAIMSGQGFYVTGDGRTIRCAPQSQSPSTGFIGQQSNLIPGAPQPYAAPIEKRRIASGPPPGYRPVWDDGRLNPHRGVAVIRVMTQ